MYARPLARLAVGETTAQPGLQPLGLGKGRDGVLLVPPGYVSTRPAPLVVMFHGAGGNGEAGLSPVSGLAAEHNLFVLSTDARATTWDVIQHGYGEDIAFLDRALDGLFSLYAIDPAHIAVGGFSDGASYALSVGLTNGDLFTHILAFSPGFMAPGQSQGAPEIYISHGTADQVLPIAMCSRTIVPALRGAGYDVVYEEFDGGHTVPSWIAQESLRWFLRNNAAASG